MSINLWSSIRNPFTRPSSNTKRFFFALNAISFGAAVILIAFNKADMAMFRVCYTRQAVNGFGFSTANTVIWLMFYMPIMVVWAGSCLVALNTAYRLKRGLRETFKARVRAMKRARNFIS